MGGSRKGFRPAVLGSMGELTDVASAKRAVLGVWRVRPEEELEEVLARTKTWEFLIFSSGVLFDMLPVASADVRLAEW